MLQDIIQSIENTEQHHSVCIQTIIGFGWVGGWVGGWGVRGGRHVQLNYVKAIMWSTVHKHDYN